MKWSQLEPRRESDETENFTDNRDVQAKGQ